MLEIKIIDLTHLITEEMTVYPGTPNPNLLTSSTHENDGFKETKIEIYSHVGTHMDSPQHIFKNGISLDRMEADTFVGKAIVIDTSDINPGDNIGMSYIDKYQESFNDAEFILFYTGWDKYWGTEMYFEDYPVLSVEAAEYIAKCGKKGVGFDTIGIDAISCEELTLHNMILRDNRMVIVENLCNLDKVGKGIFTFAALPLKYKNADGAPARVIAIV